MLTNEELADELSDVMSTTCDMDVGCSDCAKAIVRRLDKLGILRNAARWAALREDKGQELDFSSHSGRPKRLVISLDAEGCDRYLESGRPDYSATLDAILDAEISDRQI